MRETLAQDTANKLVWTPHALARALLRRLNQPLRSSRPDCHRRDSSRVLLSRGRAWSLLRQCCDGAATRRRRRRLPSAPAAGSLLPVPAHDVTKPIPRKPLPAPPVQALAPSRPRWVRSGREQPPRAQLRHGVGCAAAPSLSNETSGARCWRTCSEGRLDGAARRDVAGRATLQLSAARRWFVTRARAQRRGVRGCGGGRASRVTRG
jgi:hypothetical protein